MTTKQAIDGPETIRARHDLKLAIHNLNQHAYDCPHWDYDDNGGCTECEQHDRIVARLRKTLRDCREGSAS